MTQVSQLIWYKEPTIDVVLKIIREFMSMYQLLGNGLIIDLIDEGFMDIENKNEKIWNRYLQQDTKFQSSNQSFIQSNKMQTKGQTKSEWIYKVIEFPNNQFKNLKDFCPESFEVPGAITLN